MREEELKEDLQFIAESCELVQKWFRPLRNLTANDLTDAHQMRLDAISMRLLAIGEKIKTIETQHSGLLKKTGLEAKSIIRFRDFVAHHYDDVDYNVILDIGKNHISILKKQIKNLLATI